MSDVGTRSAARLMFEMNTMKKYMANVHEATPPEPTVASSQEQ